MAAVHAFFSIHLRADQIVGGTAINFLALGITGYFFTSSTTATTSRPTSHDPERQPPHRRACRFLGPAIGDLNLMIWVGLPPGAALVRRHVQDADRAADPGVRRASARGRHGRDQRVRGPLRGRDPLRACSPRWAAPSSRSGFVGDVQRQHDGGARLHRARRPDLRELAARSAPSSPRASSASRRRSRYRLPVYSGSAATLFQALPYVLTLIAVAGLIGRSIPPAAVGRPYRKQ